MEVTDNLPAGYAYVAGSIASDNTGTSAIITTDDSNTSALKWSIDKLEDGESVTLTFQASITTTVDYENTAEITASIQSDPIPIQHLTIMIVRKMIMQPQQL